MDPLQHMLSRLTCVVCMSIAALFAGCGGGSADQAPPVGGGPSPGTPTPSPTPSNTYPTYGTSQLPGRLIVNAPSGQAVVYDLTSGRAAVLPPSSVRSSGSSDGDEWSTANAGQLLVRHNEASSANAVINIFDVADTSQPVGSLTLNGAVVGRPRLSWDGLYVLTMLDRVGQDTELTVSRRVDGSVVETGSQLDGEVIIDDPLDWLPDGRYIYMLGNEIWATAPLESTVRRIATLALPFNATLASTGVPYYRSGASEIAVSPDGSSIAFTWDEKRGNDYDTHIWVARVDGSDLRRLTAVPDPSSPLRFRFVSPAWSPDGKWVAGLLDMSGEVVAPTFPTLDPDDFPFPITVVGTTGCGGSQVFVVSASANDVRISWPTLDAEHGLKVRAANDGEAQWVTTCGTISWSR